MRITNETYMRCPNCGADANGLDSINKVFGYMLVKDEIIPYSLCRECRKKNEPSNKDEEKWATAASWGKKINISRRKFDNYLVDLGYLDCTSLGKGKKSKLDVTEKGRFHSATTNTPFRKALLWDYETFVDVVKTRADRAVVYECCPRCKSHLDTMPGYDHSDYSHKCHCCGLDCEYWYVEIVFDK